MKRENPTMNRRDVLLGAIALVGGAGALSACGDKAAVEVDLHTGERRFFSEDQMRILSRVVDIIIPATDTPGALAAGGDFFIDGMMATWASANTQNWYVSILERIDAQAVEAFGSPLADCDADQQEQVIRDIDSTAYGDDPVVRGFRDLKYLVLAAYYTSEIGATVELQYELVPGVYLPCEPIENIGRAWAHN